MTAKDLISKALRSLGIVASGEEATASEAQDALDSLNDMLDSWNAERMMIYTIVISEFPLVTSQQTYTLGPGGNFDMARPARIERMSIVSLNNPTQPLELPLEMLTEQQWQVIPVKNVLSSLATKVYDDGANPLRNLNYWPIPTSSVRTRIYGWSALTRFADLYSSYNFPPAYAKALRYNLAVELAPEYGVSAPPEVAALAMTSKGVIKSINAPTPEMHVDSALVGMGGTKKVYNWLTDSPSSR